MWAVVGVLFGWIPFLGPLLALIAYVGVINWQYPVGWVSTTGVALVVVVASVVIRSVLALLGVVGFEAVGVPGA